MQTVPDFGERSPRHIEELQPFPFMFPRKAFHDIRCNRIGGAAELTAQLVAFVRWEGFLGKFVNEDEQIIGALPGDKCVVSHLDVSRGAHHMPIDAPLNLHNLRG